VRRGDTFPGLTEDHLRITVRPPEDTDRLLAALREVM
jgi:histidinol-phosphate aminotransferase